MDDIHIINLNNYVLPDLTPFRTRKWILNGENNSFFQYIKDRYVGSPTNSGIINSYVNYIISDGLIDKNGGNVGKYISKKDLKLICQDFKIYGQYSVEVIWSQGSKLLGVEPKPIKINYIPTRKLGLSLDKRGDVDGYWYSFDWENQNKYKPEFYKKFNGIYDEKHPMEMLTVSRISSEDYFSNPDYLAGMQWAQIEEELSNSAINHIENGFSAGKIINCKGGVPPTEELKQEVRNKIINKLTGSGNKNKLIVSFSNGLDGGNEIDVTTLEVAGLDAQLVYFSEEAQRKLFISHSVTNPILFGIPSPSGFSSASEDRITSLDHLYQSNINPMRGEIIDGLEYIFKYAEPDFKLEFQNFELKVDTNNETKQ